MRRLVLAALALGLALEVDSPWLRAASYSVTTAHGPAVLVVALPAGYPVPMGTLLRMVLTDAGCAAVAQPGSGLTLPLPVHLRVGGRPAGGWIVTRCPGP